METADQALKRFLSKSIGTADAALFDYLPYMFAVSFTTNIWKDAKYVPSIDGKIGQEVNSFCAGDTNNAHTLAKCINDLIIAFKSITTSTGDEKEIVHLLKTFVEVSSVILLRMARYYSTILFDASDLASKRTNIHQWIFHLL